MSKFDSTSEMPYEKLVANLEVVKSRLGRPLTLSEKVLYSHLDDPAGQDMDLMSVKPELLRCPPVSVDDFMNAFARIKPSVCDDDITEHIKWTEEFGQEG